MAEFLLSDHTQYRVFESGYQPEQGGVVISPLTVAYRTWGQLSAQRDNAVVVCHALTGTADADDWWKPLFGPGKALDPAKDFVVCTNILGSCYGTTGPSASNPGTGHWYGPDFPLITVRDMVRVQQMLLASLGVRKVRMVIGGSLGGMQALEWALEFPGVVESVVTIAASGRHSAWCIGLSECQRQAIAADPAWRGGWYEEGYPPSKGLGVARMIAMCTYRSGPSFERRFGRKVRQDAGFEIGSYLTYQGQKLVDRFDANTYVCLTRAMDSHDVARGRGENLEVLGRISVPTLVVSVDSDVLYLPQEQQELASSIPGAELAVLNSDDGHDAFLIEMDWLSSTVADWRQRHDV